MLVLSGTPGSASHESKNRASRPSSKSGTGFRKKPRWSGVRWRRACSRCACLQRCSARLQRHDVVLTVTAPFMLPYAVAAAARLKRARSVLIMHDLFPDVLVMAGLLRQRSILARVMRGANALMFRALDAIVIIGRDTEALLMRYRGVTPEKICFIPNWATLEPGVRPIEPDNPYRRLHAARFMVGLSGNLGFTHDPDVVFDAAQLLRDDSHIHFLLSGWGIGFDRLKELQSNAGLPNVTLVERVARGKSRGVSCRGKCLAHSLSRDFAGVSVPSRFYNLLAIGRPVILVSEANAEAALTVTEHDLGWVVEPGDPGQLAQAIRLAVLREDAARAERAVVIAQRFNFAAAMAGYSGLIARLLRPR